MTDEGNITDAEVEAALGAKSATFPHSLRTILASNGVFPSQANAVMRAALETFAASRVRPAGEPVGFTTREALAEVAEGRIGNHVFPSGTLRPENEVALYASPAPSYADAIRDAVKAVNNHRPDASFDDSSAGYVERDALLKNIAAAIEALTPGSPL